MKLLALAPLLLWLTLGSVGRTLPVAYPQYQVLGDLVDYYREADPTGYHRFHDIEHTYYIPVLFVDRESPWYKALPEGFRGAGMFVYDTPTIWIDQWDLGAYDPGKDLSVLEHEFVHVLSRWYPEYLLRTEGVAPPPIDINDWRTWAEAEVFAASIQYRVASRLGSKEGRQLALDIVRAQREEMSQERRAKFLKLYEGWLGKEIVEGLCICEK